jgi:hypothetical protein
MGPEQGGLDLGPEVLGADLLEEPSVEVTGVVDQHIDAAEPLHGSLHGRLGVGGVGDVELDGQQVGVGAEGSADPLRVAAGGDHSVAGGEGGLGDVDAHPAPRAGDEPDPLVSHLVVLSITPEPATQGRHQAGTATSFGDVRDNLARVTATGLERADERPSWVGASFSDHAQDGGSGRTVLACPTPSRKHSTNQPGTRADQWPAT